ncbi:hypothetical protein P7C70_g2471, partial [Phenoliferia sp. Uapishka_3]
MSEHGIAILGAGLFAKNAHLPALAATPAFTLKAIYSRSLASASSLLEAALELPTFAALPSPPATYSAETLPALLAREDIHTVILSLPILVQPEIIEQAWRAGKNVISEKPVAKDLAEAKRLIELYEGTYRAKGIVWIVAEQFPYLPAFAKAAELMKKGKVGELRSFALQFHTFVKKGSKYIETPWRKVPEYQGGFLLDGGVHQFAGLRHILPSPLASIISTRQLLQPHLIPYDTITGLLSLSNGLTGTFTISFGIESPAPRDLIFRGSLGCLVLDYSGPTHTITFTPTRVDGEEEGEVEEWETEANGVEMEFSWFAKALIGGQESEVAKEVDRRSGPRAAMKDLECVQRALESGESGGWSQLED